MSTTSKKRRAAREWMTRVTKQHELDCIKGMEQARERANREWRDRLTRIIPPDDHNTVYPQGRLEQPYIYVMAPTEMPDYATPIDPRNMHMRLAMSAQPIRVEAKQMAHVLPNGGKLVWWTWEVAR